MARNGRPDKSAEMVGAATGGAVCGAIRPSWAGLSGRRQALPWADGSATKVAEKRPRRGYRPP